jgi:hypothetical protein
MPSKLAVSKRAGARDRFCIQESRFKAIFDSPDRGLRSVLKTQLSNYCLHLNLYGRLAAPKASGDPDIFNLFGVDRLKGPTR